MSRLVFLNRFRRPAIWVLSIAAGAIGAWRGFAQSEAYSSAIVLARGGGTTIVQGGTGKTGNFVPVFTSLAFHVERQGGTVTGAFECLARAPESTTGARSAQFTVNAMYVTGQITGATILRDSATLTGMADITGLGAGSAVPFTLVVRNGGPGAVAVLTTEGSPRLVFNETLVEGSFQVGSDNRHER
jgi:hypothetical protein